MREAKIYIINTKKQKNYTEYGSYRLSNGGVFTPPSGGL